ncbi:hypothetical protein D9M68_790530 [compost metagenome]
MAQVDAIALVIAPQRQQDIRHHHHQGGALSQLLIQTEQHAQRRNRDQAATDTKQTAQRTQQHAENQIQCYVDQVHTGLRFDAAHASHSVLAWKRTATQNGCAYFAQASAR